MATKEQYERWERLCFDPLVKATREIKRRYGVAFDVGIDYVHLKLYAYPHRKPELRLEVDVPSLDARYPRRYANQLIAKMHGLAERLKRGCEKREECVTA